MEVIKVSLDGSLLYESFMKDEPDGKPVRLAYYIEKIDEENQLKYRSGQNAAYHVLMDGIAVYSKNSEPDVAVQKGEDFYCELEDSMEVSGNGKVLSMVMEKGVRGVVRKLNVQKESTFKIGEAIGESCVALVGLNGSFEMECEQGRFECDSNHMLFIRVARKEFASIRLISNDDMQVALMNGVKMCDSDFSNFLGMKILEQGKGHCKVGMEVKKEHMNPIGSVHGGVMFTMADQACGIAAATTGGVCTTVNSQIEFLNAAINVKYLTAEAKPKKIGKKIRIFNVDIRDEKDVLIASADFTFFCLQN